MFPMCLVRMHLPDKMGKRKGVARLLFSVLSQSLVLVVPCFPSTPSLLPVGRGCSQRFPSVCRTTVLNHTSRTLPHLPRFLVVFQLAFNRQSTQGPIRFSLNSLFFLSFFTPLFFFSFSLDPLLRLPTHTDTRPLSLSLFSFLSSFYPSPFHIH